MDCDVVVQIADDGSLFVDENITFAFVTAACSFGRGVDDAAGQ